MKKVFIFLVVFSMSLYSFGQTYLINFTAGGGASEVDMVIVENFTTGTILSLGGSDTLKLVLGPSSITNYSGMEKPADVFPNPNNGDFSLEFSMESAENILFEIFDIQGKLVLSQSEFLMNGTHAFRITGLPKGVYTIVYGTSFSKNSTKVLSTNTSSESISFQKSEVKGSIVKVLNTKKQKNQIEMPYSQSDILRITGSKNSFSTIVMDVPTSSKTIHFNFHNCIDGSGNHYPIVQINNQWWMAENLKTTKYSDGTSIANITDDAEWCNLTTPAYCWYDNSVSNANIWGGLYNWYAVSPTTNGNKNVCPVGWHVPNESEWDALRDFLGTEFNAGTKVKEIGLDYWNPSDEVVTTTNRSGFGARGSGSKDIQLDGTFVALRFDVSYWSATQNNAVSAFYRLLSYNSDAFELREHNKKMGYSVRCIKN